MSSSTALCYPRNTCLSPQGGWGNPTASSSRSHPSRSRQWEGTDIPAQPEGRIASSKPQMASLRLPGMGKWESALLCDTAEAQGWLLSQHQGLNTDTGTLCTSQRPTRISPVSGEGPGSGSFNSSLIFPLISSGKAPRTAPPCATSTPTLQLPAQSKARFPTHRGFVSKDTKAPSRAEVSGPQHLSTPL